MAHTERTAARRWAAELVGISMQTADAAVAAFRSGDRLPVELLEALAQPAGT